MHITAIVVGKYCTKYNNTDTITIVQNILKSAYKIDTHRLSLTLWLGDCSVLE